MVINNKRASGIFDPIVIIIFVVVTFFVSMLSLFVFNEFNTALQADTSIDATTKQASADYSANWIDVADIAIMVWFVILWVGALVTSFFLFNNPIFYIVFILLSIFSFFALIPFSNVVSEMCLASAFVTTCGYFPITTYFIDKIAIVITLFIFSIGMTLYAKVKTQ